MEFINPFKTELAMSYSGNYANLGQQLPDVGSMDRRITIQTWTASQSTTGEAVNTWADWRTVWAKIRYIKTGNGEDFGIDTQLAKSRIEYTFRYTGTVTEKMRIVDEDGVILDIINIDVLGRRKFEVATCEARV